MIRVLALYSNSKCVTISDGNLLISPHRKMYFRASESASPD